MSAVGGKERFALCFWVSGNIPFQQTKPDHASNSAGLGFSAFCSKNYGSAHSACCTLPLVFRGT
jgi:hypothetical protein